MKTTTMHFSSLFLQVAIPASILLSGCALDPEDAGELDPTVTESTSTETLEVTDPIESSICAAGPSVPAPKKIIYVDKDDPACSDGSSGNVYCSIQAAVKAINGDGTAVRIRNSSHPYDETVVLRKKSGTAAHPIVLEAAPGHKPVLTGGDAGPNSGWGMLSIDDSSHVVVRNLTFNGFGKTTKAGKAIYVKASTGDVKNVVIANNKILNWVGAAPKSSEAIGFGRNHPYQVRSSSIRCNTIDKSGRGIGVNGTGALIEYNKMTHMSCQGLDHYAVISASNSSGIGKGPNGTRETLDVDLVIRKNYVSGPFSDCPAANGGLWCDVGLAGGEVDGNTFVDVFEAGQSSFGSFGVHIESRCNDWKVRNNLVMNTKPASQVDTYYASYRARGTDNTTFENNVSCSAGGRAYWILGEAGNHVYIKNNKAYGTNLLLRGGFGEGGAIINGLDMPDGKPFDKVLQDKMFTDKNTYMGSAACPLGSGPLP